MASRSQFSQALVSLSLIVSLFIAVYSQAPAQAQTAAAPNVIAIGDSVTEDFGNGGWRGPLKTKLAAVGQAINYVGSRSDGAGSHEAYGGATSCDFSTDRGSFMADTYGKSATWDIRTALAAAAPNIAIIDIGTNNYIEDYYLAQGLATTVPCGLNPGSLRWLWDAVVYYPGITGVVITTIEDAMIPDGTENVNVLVRQYVADRQAQGLNVCLGDLPSSFAGLTTDRYHLNAAGKDAVATALLEPTLTAIAGTCAAAVTGTLPVVTIAASIPNAAEPSTNGQFTVSRTGGTASSLTVNFTVSGSATAGSDYANIGTSVVIAAGSATAAIAVNVIDDTIYEGNETVVVTLSPNASYAVGSANSATVTIADNESAPALSVSPNGASPGDLLTVTWNSIANPTARDWLGLFAAGVGNGSYAMWFYVNCSQGGSAVAKASGACIVALPGVANGTYEFRMFSNDSSNVIAKSNALVVGVPVVGIAATANAAEPSTNGQFTVSRTGSTASSLTVNFTVSGSATAGADYANLGTSVVIPAGAAVATIAVNVIDDTIYEGSETVVVTLTANPAYIIGSANATVTIADDDKPVVSIIATDAVAAEAGLDTGTFTVSRDGATTAPLAVNYAVGGTAINGVDYQLLSGSLTIPAGQVSGTIVVTPIDDNLFEGNETVILTLIGNGSYLPGIPNSATVTILDNDLPAVSIVATDAVAAEAGLDTGTFTVSRDGITTAPLTVNYTVGGTATNGVDYQSLSGSLTIPAGQASGTIVVKPIDDSTPEGNETVVLTLVTGGGYIIGSPNSATVTIADDDLPVTHAGNNDGTARCDIDEVEFDSMLDATFVREQVQYADLNGDGKADLIFQGVDDIFWVSLSTACGFTSPTPWMQHGGSFVKGQAQYADLNGDGKADLILQGWNNTFWVSLSTGTGFTSPTLWMQHGGSFVKGQAQYADLNGDGKADLILQGWNNTFWVSLSTGTGFTSPTLWMQHGGSFAEGQAQYADLNGDGKADLILQGWNNTFWVSQSTGTGFTSPTLWMQHGGSFVKGQAQYADLNGDGKADLILQGWNNIFWVSLSTGTGFTSPTLWMQHGGSFAEGQAQYADLNGDGKADLIMQGIDNIFWVSLSTGTGFTSPTPWMQHGGSFLEGQAQYADLNGDGKADLIMQGVDNVFWVSLSTGTGFTAPTPWMQHGGK